MALFDKARHQVAADVAAASYDNRVD
jgi:hypothetical protein